MKKTAILVFISVCVIFVLVFAIIAFSISFNRLRRNEHISNNEHTFNLEETVGTWELLWEQPNIHIGWSLPRNHFTAAMNTLCYIVEQKPDLFRRQQSLHCVDIHNGKQKWIGQADSGSDITNDETQIYVGELIPPYITVYNAENGQKVWHRNVEARTISTMTAYGGFASVHGNPGIFYIFDASNGSLQSKDSVPIMKFDSFANDGHVRFDHPGGSYIRAYDIQDNSLIWKTDVEDAIVYRPVFKDGLIFARSGRHRGTIHVIDGKTGHLLWEKEGVVSDFGVSNSTVFFVTMHGEIMAVDAQTGETQGKLILDKAELNANTSATRITPYYVRAIDDIVLVYLGNTNQLFSFQYSNE